MRGVRLSTVVALITGSISSAPALAQQYADPSEAAQVDEIVVTGERVARTLKATSSSVDVTSAEEIDAQAAPDRVEQILALVPNVQLGAGDSGPTIRGQDTGGVLQGADAFLGGSRPRATIRVDGRSLGYNEFIYGLSSVWDVARVEVFRTPQTTTQGRNSIAGAIFIETADPTYEIEGRARLIGSNYDTWQASGVVSGPLVADQLAVRFAVDQRNSTSWSRVEAEPPSDGTARRASARGRSAAEDGEDRLSCLARSRGTRRGRKSAGAVAGPARLRSDRPSRKAEARLSRAGASACAPA